MSNNTDYSLDRLLGSTLFFLIWPFFNLYAIVEILGAIGYELILGQAILEFLFCTLLFLGGLGCLVALLYAFREKHAPINFKKIFAWVVGAFIVSSAVNLAITFPVSCKTSTGNCNNYN
jgi:hypothetical protein